MNDDSIDAMLSAHSANRSLHTSALTDLYSKVTPMTSADQVAWDKMQEDLLMRRVETNRQEAALAEFRKSYIKIRTDNIVLDHQCAIELTKMIFTEAATLTYKDTL